MVLGLWVAFNGLPKWPAQDLAFDKLQGGEAPESARLLGHYAAQSVERYEIRRGDAAALALESVVYRGKTGAPLRAILYPEAAAPIPGASKRRDLWSAAAKAIGQHSRDQAMFLSWWDNAQRIDFLTGRTNWVLTPSATAFANRTERMLWNQLAGPLEPDDRRLRQLARWLAMDAGEALTEMAKQLPGEVPVYLLACVDDLARVAEIERLSGKKLGIEAAVFSGSADFHGQIAQVKRWAGEKGAGNYLVQSVPGGVRAWRVTDGATENSLLVRLLPFTVSLARPLPGISTVYQSAWGGYLTIFEVGGSPGR
jgi:hydroxylamine oxidation protein HaoB